jgi:hypothetical protein
LRYSRGTVVGDLNSEALLKLSDCIYILERKASRIEYTGTFPGTYSDYLLEHFKTA